MTAYLLSFHLECVTGNTLVYISVSGVTGPSHLLQVGKYMETCQTLYFLVFLSQVTTECHLEKPRVYWYKYSIDTEIS